MLDYFKIAWRNLSRNKVRCFISVLAIAVVVMIVVFSRGLILGFGDSFYGLYIDNNAGHVKVINEEYRHREQLLSLEYTINGFQENGLKNMLAEMEQVEGVEYLLPRLKFGASFAADNELVRMAGVGIDPVAEKKHGTIPEDITKGRMPAGGDEILVGKGLLEEMGAEVGDRVTLMYSDSFYSLRGRTFTVVGVRESGFSTLDDNLFYLPLGRAQTILGLEDRATEILVFGSSREQSGDLEKNLTALFSGRNEEDKYTIIPWEQAHTFVEVLKQMDMSWNMIYAGFILMGSIIVISTLIMIVRERRPEIGMMAALGLRGKDIMKIFTFEGAMMGLMGSLLGTVIGGMINFYFSQKGLYVGVLEELVEGMGIMMEPAFYPVYNPENLIVSFLFGFVIVTLSCLYPARKAAKLEPVEALHVEE